MATEHDPILMARQKAKRSIIANSIGLCAGVLITILTLLSPSPIFLVAWGAIIFCPISAVRSYSRYRKLGGLLQSGTSTDSRPA
ncbi:MAG: hypothetical protein ABI361_13240 [Nitrososphaera sp.]|jgi:hypothetical protein